jgi:hypothetical protein
MLQAKQLIDVENEGLVALLESEVVLFCANYVYTGKLVGVNDTCLKLENPAIVYETGEYTGGYSWKDAQRLPVKHQYVMLSAIESFGLKK